MAWKPHATIARKNIVTLKIPNPVGDKVFERMYPQNDEKVPLSSILEQTVCSRLKFFIISLAVPAK